MDARPNPNVFAAISIAACIIRTIAFFF